MAHVPEYMKKVAGWEQTIAAYIANAGDFERFEPDRVRLELITGRVKTLVNERAAFAASKQDATQEIQALFREGETLVDHLRTAVREHYGLNSEKLVEFGLRPSRTRSRRAKLPEEPETPPKPTTAPAAGE